MNDVVLRGSNDLFVVIGEVKVVDVFLVVLEFFDCLFGFNIDNLDGVVVIGKCDKVIVWMIVVGYYFGYGCLVDFVD